MSATVHRIHPDGPGIVELRGRQMRALAHDLGFENLAATMLACATQPSCTLTTLDAQATALSTMLHGYELAFERHGKRGHEDRARIAELRTAISNYMQERTNEL
jgi:hypothetical protein